MTRPIGHSQPPHTPPGAAGHPSPLHGSPHTGSRYRPGSGPSGGRREDRRHRHTITAVANSPNVAGATENQLIRPGDTTADPIAAYPKADGIEASTLPARYGSSRAPVVP